MKASKTGISKTNSASTEIENHPPQSIATTGIIGHGAFGRLVEQLLAERGLEVRVFSRSQEPDGVRFFSLEEVCQCDFIIPSVPIAAFEQTIKKITPLLRSGATVLDVCSVKVHPKEVMLKNLPESVNIIASHPNFGPESYKLNARSTKGLNLILENVRCREDIYQQVKQFAEKQLELNVVELTAEEHDRTIGVAHFASMLTGQILSKLELEEVSHGAASTKAMFAMLKGVGADQQILLDMYHYNPFAHEYLEKFTSEYNSLLKSIHG